MGDTYSLGLDFGTESVRALIVRHRDGLIAGQSASAYRSGVITESLPSIHRSLPPDYALQDARDWLESAGTASRAAIAASDIAPAAVKGIGVAFTSCTMLPCKSDGTPLHDSNEFADVPLAWPRLWKHHAAKAETDRVNQIAQERGEPWLSRYGGVIGLEWFFPKVLETLNHAPHAYDAADIWIEAGDWLVWQLISGPFPQCKRGELVRSTCQAGYKAMWNADSGYPSRDYFAALHPAMADVVSSKMPGKMQAPGVRAGGLTHEAATLLGLAEGTAVSTATIDAHAGVPGAGVADDGTLVLVMGTSSCHMLNSTVEQMVPGVAGVVKDGILPGYFGYETGQASVGDSFAWVAGLVQTSHESLSADAAKLRPGSGGVLALDWLNGCRTPLMDGRISGALVGLTLNTKPPQIYRAMLEATAMGVRWIVQSLREAGVPVRKFVASGGLPTKSPLLMQIYADVLGEEIRLAQTDQPVALGAAILGRLAAETEEASPKRIADTIRAMARQREDLIYRPDPENVKAYERIYPLYRSLTESQSAVANAMRQLRCLG